MDFNSVDLTMAIDVFLLLLIGIGPKIALVPFLELSAKMDEPTKERVIRKMLRTASITAILLMVFGGLLTRLLHFSTGALAIAGGIILLVISLAMILSRGEGQTQHDADSAGATDPLRLAVFPLAVPYLLNPAGIVTLVTVSAEAESLGIFALVLVLLAVVIGIDVVVFRWARQVSAHLDASRMLVTEKVFGFLLAALAVQLVLEGLVQRRRDSPGRALGFLLAAEPRLGLRMSASSKPASAAAECAIRASGGAAFCHPRRRVSWPEALQARFEPSASAHS